MLFVLCGARKGRLALQGEMTSTYGFGNLLSVSLDVNSGLIQGTRKTSGTISDLLVLSRV